MSWQAMTWANEDPRSLTLPASALRVLICLGGNARADGTRAIASATSLAERLGVSERTVERAISRLQAEGLIRHGEQDVVANRRGGHRPVVWDLDCSPAVTETGPSRADTAVGPHVEGRQAPPGWADRPPPRGPTPGVGQNKYLNVRNERAGADRRAAGDRRTVTAGDIVWCRSCALQHDPVELCSDVSRPAPSGWRTSAAPRLSAVPGMIGGADTPRRRGAPAPREESTA